MSSNGNKLELPSSIVIRDLAQKIEKSPIDLIKKLMSNGVMATINQAVDFDTAAIVMAEYGFEAVPEVVEEVKVEDGEVPLWRQLIAGEDEAQLEERPPVVTVMGHVDHGKTSLLDAIRETEVVAGEAGGITQHIGAYQVHQDGKTITFLDTPGHEAFTAMRARGAQSTDIAVIVVAADDGVKPQTREAVDHAKAAEVPILVAANTHQNLDDLLESLLLMAEVEELKANPDTEASGVVIESKLDPGRGAVVTVLVQRGTLKVGDALVAGAHWGRVRALHDYKGRKVKEATPSEPVEVLGFDTVPEAGEYVRVVENDRRARHLANERATRLKTEALARRSGKKVSLETIFDQA